MSRVSVNHDGEIIEEKEVTLKVDDYVLEINNVDVYRAKLKYSIEKFKSKVYDNGKVVEEKDDTNFNFNIWGCDISENNELDIEFKLFKTLDDLNELESDKPIDISKSIGAIYIKEQNEETYEGVYSYTEKGTIDDMYKKVSTMLVYKLEDNKFIFKIQIPDKVFLYFKIDFNER